MPSWKSHPSAVRYERSKSCHTSSRANNFFIFTFLSKSPGNILAFIGNGSDVYNVNSFYEWCRCEFFFFCGRGKFHYVECTYNIIACSVEKSYCVVRVFHTSGDQNHEDFSIIYIICTHYRFYVYTFRRGIEKVQIQFSIVQGE